MAVNMSDFIGIKSYCDKVLNNKIVACNKVKQACERHMRDLKKSKDDKSYPYYFDAIQAYMAITFAKNVMSASGLKIADMQRFIIGCLFGWRKKEVYKVDKNTGYKYHHLRFRLAYIQVARKNSKTYLIAICVLYMLLTCDNIEESYITAGSLSQAGICFREIQKLMMSNKFIKKQIMAMDNGKNIITLNNFCLIKSLSGNSTTKDGYKGVINIVDELHSSDDKNYNLMKDGQNGMEESLLIAITTAGFKKECFCKDLYNYNSKVLNNEVEDEEDFIYIAELDKEDRKIEKLIANPELIYKANPLAYTNNALFTNINKEINRCKYMNETQRLDLFVKSLNVWLSSKPKDKFIDLDELKECRSDDTLLSYKDKKLNSVIGIDLSLGGDLISVAYAIKDSTNKVLFIGEHSWILRDRYEAKKNETNNNNADYEGWVNMGLISLMDKLDLSFTDIIAYIDYVNTIVPVEAICYDPYKGQLLANELSCKYMTINISDSVRFLNVATMLFRNYVHNSLFKYNAGDGLLEYCLDNAIIITNADGYQKIDKKKYLEKIDVADAFILIFRYIASLSKKIKVDINDINRQLGFFDN